MRVGFDISPLCEPLSGVGRYTAQLLAHIHPLLGNHLVPMAHRPPLQGLGGSLFLRATLVPRLHFNKTAWIQTILPVQIAREHLDVCHFTNGVAPLCCPCPIVVTVHDAGLWLYPQFHYPRRLIAMRPFISLVARRAGAIITVSQSARRDLMRVLRVAPEKIHVIYEAPAPNFRPLLAGEWREGVRRRYRLPERFILFVGNIEPRKNLPRLIRAFALLKRGRGIPHKLVIVGQRGWKDQEVFTTVTRLGIEREILFLGYVSDEDLVSLYNLADVFTFPSLYEGFGLPVVEAMACGVPVLTSNTSALAEIAGPAAELVDPRDVKSIAEGLHRLITDVSLAEERRERGLRWVRRFRWERAAWETYQLYRTACRPHAGDERPAIAS